MRGIRLSIKLTSLVILAVFLTAMVGTMLAILIGRTTLKTRESSHNVESVQTYASAINFYLGNARSVLETMVHLPEIIDSTSARFIDPQLHGLPANMDKGKRNIARQTMEHSKIFEYMMLLRADGSVYFLEPYDLQFKLSSHDLSFFKWYRDLISTGKTVVSDLHISPATQKPTVMIATPVYNATGHLVGIWAGALELEELSKIGHGELSAGTPAHYGYVTDSRGLIIAHETNPKYVEEQTDFSSVEPVHRTLSGKRGTVQFINPIEGVEELGAYMPLPGTGWAVVYVVPTTIAFAPMDELARNIALFAGVVAVILGLVSIGFLRKALVPLSDLAKAAEKIGAGDYTQRVQVKTGDEIERLGDEFNRMVASLSEKEAQLHEYTQQLEQKVQERTKGLQESEERFRIGATSASDLIWDWDIPSGRLDWFGDIDGILGYQPREFPRTIDAWEKAIQSDDVSRVNATLERHLKEGEPYYEEYRIRCRDGTYRYWTDRGTAMRDEKGEPYRMIGACSDITERKRAEEALRASEEHYRTLFGETLDGICLADAETGIIIDCNQAMAALVCRERAELIGRPQTILHPPQNDKATFSPTFKQHLTDKQGQIIETQVVTRTGDIREVEIKANFLNLQGRKLMQGLFYNITERKRAEEEIRTLNAELEQRVVQRTAQLEAANKELEAFSYSVSHDLRAPLRAIDGFSRVILEDYIEKLDDEGRRYLNIIRSNTQKMGQLIDDLLLFSRLGRQEIRVSEMDMGKLAKAVSEELKLVVPERKLKFTINTLIPAQGDQAMIRQVFVNLLSNAVKFTRPKERAVIEVDGRSEGNENVYTVKDNGVGFDMQYVGKLFGVFQRLHSAAEFEGTGVGLAIVQRIIHRHGGRVWGEGKVNEGATFFFTLPRKDNR